MKKVFLSWWLFSSWLLAQGSLDPSVRSLRVVGQGFGGQPIIVDGVRIRVQFEGNSAQPVDYRIRIRHLDAEGQETANVFVNDPVRSSTLTPIPYRTAPTGARTWRWKYETMIPGPAGLDQIPHSGYYRGWIEEFGSGRVVATFDFVKADRNVTPLMRVRQRRLPSAVAPYNEAIAVSVSIPLDTAWIDGGPIHPLLIRSVDVVKNREWSRRTRVQVYDDDPHAWVEGSGTDRMVYIAGGILPGNEYRQVDFRTLDEYPPGDTLRSRAGADVSRFFFPGRPDHNGLPAYAETAGGADEELVEFQLLWPGDDDGALPSVAVVGEFNGWTVRPEWTMTYDRGRRRFVLCQPLRRGRYDYQYVVDGEDWVRLEGNTWSTRNLYTAFIVYQDRRYGGFDRIIGVGQVESNGASPGERSRDTF